MSHLTGSTFSIHRLVEPVENFRLRFQGRGGPDPMSWGEFQRFQGKNGFRGGVCDPQRSRQAREGIDG